MGEERDRMNDYYITFESPTRARRGSTRLIVVVKDSQGTEIFRDRADINEENLRSKVAERIAQFALPHFEGTRRGNFIVILMGM